MEKKTRKISESQSKALAKYQDAHTRRFSLKLVDTTDADIIAKLESVPNKQGYIKDLIRADIKKSES